jgi:hypothetical protein
MGMRDRLDDADAHMCRSSDFDPAFKMKGEDIVSAKNRTLDLFASLGVVDDEDLASPSVYDKEVARDVFAAVMDPTKAPQVKQNKALMLKTPTAAAYVSTMLQAYDWDFAAQAGNIRSFVVTKLLEESENYKNSTKERLRALELLGKVSDVNLFSERIQVNIAQTPQAELEKRLKEKLDAFEIVDVEAKNVRNEGDATPGGD